MKNKSHQPRTYKAAFREVHVLSDSVQKRVKVGCDRRWASVSPDTVLFAAPFSVYTIYMLGKAF